MLHTLPPSVHYFPLINCSRAIDMCTFIGGGLGGGGWPIRSAVKFKKVTLIPPARLPRALCGASFTGSPILFGAPSLAPLHKCILHLERGRG